jgi:hypothetical protein
MNYKQCTILEQIRSNLKEAVTNAVLDNLISSCANLSEINVEFDEIDPTMIHVKLPTILENSKK